MTTIVIFHSVLGLRSVERDAAERLRTLGFDVALPDLYAGKHTESLDSGFRLMDDISWPVICQRASEAVRRLEDTTILVGFSMGAGVIASLWPQRPKSKAVLLFHGLADVPSNVRSGLMVQTHIASPDPLVSAEQGAIWAKSVRAARLSVEEHNYINVGHFFTDFTSSDYDAAASELAWRRAIQFVQRASSET